MWRNVQHWVMSTKYSPSIYDCENMPKDHTHIVLSYFEDDYDYNAQYSDADSDD